MENVILTEQDIINTYDKRQQEQCRLYYEYQRIKKENPEFGYKIISKMMGQQEAKTRWWHCGKYTPVPVQTVNWLKEKGLIPLVHNNHKLLLISRIVGSTFGDGGIFGNLNAIFLSSAELNAVKEFGEDLKELFGEDVDKNFRIIEGGEYGHSWCYQNTNRNVIRFFKALGAPIGDKAQEKLIVPKWIKNKINIEDEFYGSLFGGELNVPKVHINGNHLDTLSFGITGKDELGNNRIEFLTEIAQYLNKNNIKTGKISINDHKKQNRKGEATKIYRLLISTEFENVKNFFDSIKITYCIYKKVKLNSTINLFSQIKKQRFKDLLARGYSSEGAMNLLNLTPTALAFILNEEKTKQTNH